MNTLRYCKVCEKNRIFEMNPFTTHSECIECGSRFAGVVNERMLFADEIVGHINNRIGVLISHKQQKNEPFCNIDKLNSKIDELGELKKWLLRIYGKSKQGDK